MPEGRSILEGHSQPAFSVRSLPTGLRQITALVCLLLFIQVIYLPLQAEPGARQIQPMKRVVPLNQKIVSQTMNFSITGTGEAAFSLSIGTAGKIRATTSWTGTAGSLALILNGPGQTQYYARRDGGSPLNLEFEISQELLAQGNGWKLRIASFQPGISAEGKIILELPAGSSVVQQSGQPKAAVQDRAISTATPAQPKANTQAVPADKTESASSKTGLAAKKPSLKELLGARKAEEKQAAQAVEITEDLAPLQKSIESGIQQMTRQSPLGGIVVPLFFKYLEEAADNQRLLREFYRDSAHKRGQTEADLARLLQRPVRAYRQIPRDFKARYLHPAYVDLKKGDRLDLNQLGREVVQKVNPNLERQVKQIARESFSGKYMLTREQVLAGQKVVPLSGLKKISGEQRAMRAQVRVSRPAVQAASAIVPRLSARPSEIELANLKQSLQQAGVQIPDGLTRGSLVHDLLHLSDPGASLRQIDGRKFETDYYRYLVTLDWFRCLDKNERSNDEPYFGVLTNLPQFDPGDPNYFKYLKDGCLNRTDSYVTRTYGGVGKNTDHGLKGDDRIIFDYLTFNSPASFTIDLWEEDYSKGSVADGLRQAALDVMLRVKDDIKAAIMSQVQAYIAEAILSSSGVSSSGAMQLLDQIFTGNLSLADFQSLLFNLYSGRAFDASWYLVYFLFSGGDLMQTVAMIGGGSTVVGAVILGLAIVGPAFSDMVSAFSSGDVNAGLVNLFKIITVVPLLVDFFGTIIRSLVDLFYAIMALVDPDDHLGQRTVVIQQTSANWHNDAKDGEWAQRNLMGAVPITEAGGLFSRRGYGPTASNSSFSENNLFWVPGFIIKGGDAEYAVYYEVFREKAGGRTTLGFYFPESPALNARQFLYQSKSSPSAWWPNLLRISVMSVNTQETPLVFVTDKKAGKTYTNADLGNSFELEENFGAEYEVWVMKLSAGEMAGYVSIYEGPQVEVVCPKAKGHGGSGAGLPPGSRRTQVK
ncbi:MAG: hypothetical protein N3G18_04680 [Candidatus Saccharicenans sp.]|nr:hypothetical protein [Candidatus Saccharicenans sp.]